MTEALLRLLQDRIAAIGFRGIASASLHHCHRLPSITFVDLRHTSLNDDSLYPMDTSRTLGVYLHALVEK